MQYTRIFGLTGKFPLRFLTSGEEDTHSKVEIHTVRHKKKYLVACLKISAIHGPYATNSSTRHSFQNVLLMKHLTKELLPKTVVHTLRCELTFHNEIVHHLSVGFQTRANR
jgi:hypothetical protein